MLTAAPRASLAAALAAALVAAALAGLGGGVAGAASAQAPAPGSLYKDGPSGRYTLGGTWLFRFDDGVGLAHRFQDSVSTAGWTPVSVPYAWNGGQTGSASYAPDVGWYRRDFTLPSSSPNEQWIVRFESVNNVATVWLNGHEIGTHTGAFLAFEIPLPAAELLRGAVNRLVIRVSDAHGPTDLPPLEPGTPAVVGGWWNYGGVLREVYLERVTDIEFASVQVLPRLSCATCAAEIDYSAVLHNYAASARRVALRTSFGGIVAALGERTIAAGASATFTGHLRVARPILWSPASPHLYPVTLDAAAGAVGARYLSAAASYFVESGIRAVTVVNGQLELNFEPLHARGVGLIEDSPTDGSALSPAQQEQLILDAKSLGATLIRTQYPLSQYEEQLADEMGIMIWSEIPAYQVPDTELRAITPTAVAELREDILENGNHPSIIVWSVANELDPTVGPSQTAYIDATVAAVHSLDPTRPVGLAFAGLPSTPCQKGYDALDVLGINDYFGWYPGPYGEIADPSLLSDFLAQERACYPKQALLVTEYGAEANRDGPIDERGTYEYQSQFITDQLATFDATPWLSGAVYWALQDFLVWPGWTGENPYPDPPVFNKGLFTLAGAPKPAVAVVRQAYTSTAQVGSYVPTGATGVTGASGATGLTGASGATGST